MVTEPTDETIIHESLGVTQQDINPPSSSSTAFSLFLVTLAVTPPPTFAGGLLSNIERFHKAKSLQSADWVDSSFGMVENHTAG